MIDGNGPQRDADLVLARAHLRLGALGLARAELETMAGRDLLDDEGIRDLAEARWRTGDTVGAGEAAATYLEIVPEDVLALVIAAEAQSELGRPGEARRLAGKAMERAAGSLDPVFAGMRRSSVWPVESESGVAPAGVLFDDLHPLPVPRTVGHDRRLSDPQELAGRDEPHAPLDPALPAEFSHGPGLWDDSEGEPVDTAPVTPMELFHQARAALDEGKPDAAATGLLLALRSQPSLAPAVLDLLAGRSEPILVLVRGDALAIVGRSAEAARDHAAAAQVVGEVAPEAAGGEVAPEDATDRAADGEATAAADDGAVAAGAADDGTVAGETDASAAESTVDTPETSSPHR
jgi:hypothetical protein